LKTFGRIFFSLFWMAMAASCAPTAGRLPCGPGYPQYGGIGASISSAGDLRAFSPA
jgi:hypothetical protein